MKLFVVVLSALCLGFFVGDLDRTGIFDMDGGWLI